jgi:glycosyltransferase involved in cell wall biosynthesis
VVAQDWPSIEVVVVDDCSPDDTAAVAERYAKLPVRIVRRTANGGAAAALNSGVEAARHDLVAFLDADDEWLPGKLAAQVEALAATPEPLMVATGFASIAEDGRLNYVYGLDPFAHGPAEFWRNLLLDSAIKKSSVLMRRRLYLAIGGSDARLNTGSDQDLFFRVAALGPVAYVHRHLVQYYSTPGSLTRAPRRGTGLRALERIEGHIDALSSRLTPAERRAAIGRRNAITAINLIAARDWGPALRCTAVAIVNGDRPAENLWRLVTNAPGVRTLKRLVRQS